MTRLHPAAMKIGGYYNWIGQPERLVYTGRTRCRIGGGFWNRFEKVDEPGVVWCEVPDGDLPMLEETLGKPLTNTLKGAKYD